MPQGAREILQDTSDISGLLPPLPLSNSARGCQAGLLELPPPHWHPSGLAQPRGTHLCSCSCLLGITRRANPALFVTRNQRGGLREERSPARKVAHNPCGQGRDTADPWCLLGVQRHRQHHQAFSTTPLFWFVPFLTQFILQAWLSPI